MKTEVKRINPTRVKLTITVDQQSFKPALDRAYKTVSEQVNIPGFRKGKVPAAVLDQRLAKMPLSDRQSMTDSMSSIEMH